MASLNEVVDFPELELTPIRTSTEPDVIIIQEVASPEESAAERWEVADMSKVPTESEDGLPSIPSTEARYDVLPPISRRAPPPADKTSTEPDVVIIEDDHVALPEESAAESREVTDMSKVPTESEDGPPSIPPTEPQYDDLPPVSPVEPPPVAKTSTEPDVVIIQDDRVASTEESAAESRKVPNLPKVLTESEDCLPSIPPTELEYDDLPPIPQLEPPPADKTSTEPDVVIIQDDHVASPEESTAKSVEVVYLSKVPTESEDGLPSILPTEPEDDDLPPVSYLEPPPAGKTSTEPDVVIIQNDHVASPTAESGEVVCMPKVVTEPEDGLSSTPPTELQNNSAPQISRLGPSPAGKTSTEPDVPDHHIVMPEESGVEPEEAADMLKIPKESEAGLPLTPPRESRYDSIPPISQSGSPPAGKASTEPDVIIQDDDVASPEESAAESREMPDLPKVPTEPEGGLLPTLPTELHYDDLSPTSRPGPTLAGKTLTEPEVAIIQDNHVASPEKSAAEPGADTLKVPTESGDGLTSTPAEPKDDFIPPVSQLGPSPAGKTLIEPDAIIQDRHVVPPEESAAESGDVPDMPKIPKKSEDDLRSTPPTEAQDDVFPPIFQSGPSPAGKAEQITHAVKKF